MASFNASAARFFKALASSEARAALTASTVDLDADLTSSDSTKLLTAEKARPGAALTSSWNSLLSSLDWIAFLASPVKEVARLLMSARKSGSDRGSERTCKDDMVRAGLQAGMKAVAPAKTKKRAKMERMDIMLLKEVKRRRSSGGSCVSEEIV